MFADYAIVLEDAPLEHAIVRSARLWRRRASQAMLVFVTSIIVGQLVFSLFVQKLDDSDGVFPGFFGALLLVAALFAYASDCLLIALLLENPDEAPVTARESESRSELQGSTFGFSSVSASTRGLEVVGDRRERLAVLDAVELLRHRARGRVAAAVVADAVVAGRACASLRRASSVSVTTETTITTATISAAGATNVHAEKRRYERRRAAMRLGSRKRMLYDIPRRDAMLLR